MIVKRIKLLGKIGKGYEVVKKITMTIEYCRKDKLWICSDNIFFAYGSGDTENEAIKDYKITLTDLYDFGEKDNSPEKSHSTYLKEITKIQRYIKKKIKPFELEKFVDDFYALHKDFFEELARR